MQANGEPGAFTKVSALGVEAQRVWLVVDLTAPRERRASLGDGFRVDARTAVAASEGAILVPIGALFRRGGGWAVLVAEGGVARECAATLARRRRTLSAAVASGPVARGRGGGAVPAERAARLRPGADRGMHPGRRDGWGSGMRRRGGPACRGRPA